jgi:hypothetical protein
MSSANLDAVIRKIADLRRLATSSNLHEAEVAAAAAARLAEKHRISEAEIEASGTEPGERAVQDGEPLEEERGRASLWRGQLALVLAKHYGCVLIRAATVENGIKLLRMRIIGRPSDTTLVRYLYGWLSLDLARIAAKESAGRGLAWKNSWLLGAVTGLRAQLDRAASQERASADTAALVRLDARGADAAEALRAAYPKIEVTAPRHRFVDKDGFESGQAHGRNVHRGGQLEGRAVRRLGG